MKTWLQQSGFLALAVLLFHPGRWNDTRSVSAQSGNVKILFVGNSLTYTNDIPSLVAEMGRQNGVVVQYSSLLYPDYSLEDHWKEGKVKKEIDDGAYDFVVAQQGPSALPESRALLIEYAGKIAEHCRQKNTRMALYMVWPSRARSFDLDNVIASYTKAAGATHSLLCPAGLAWKYAWQSDSTLSLYGDDNFHPSMTGSVLAALVIYGTISGRTDWDDWKKSEYSWGGEVTDDVWKLLRQAAGRSLGR